MHSLDITANFQALLLVQKLLQLKNRTHILIKGEKQKQKQKILKETRK
jgi:hypothetical protein